MSETLEVIRTRRSVKSYSDQSVPRELVEKVCEAGTWAPCGMGKQAPIILAVTNKELRDRIAKLNAAVMGGKNDPFYGAPVVLVVLANKAVGTYLYDGSLTMENMMLAAHDLGLGACWIHRAKEVFASEEGKAILKDLGVEGDYEGIGNCILGYPKGELPAAKPRKEGYIVWAE
ncbi:MAG: nitroreductase [Oscillospiraceae bacterium]|nr:nitroreductase [Oscillospiraceae bacterium]